jgi:hypothetical protein
MQYSKQTYPSVYCFFKAVITLKLKLQIKLELVLELEWEALQRWVESATVGSGEGLPNYMLIHFNI